jgi:alcohol dehydrogenase class IV
MRALAEAFGFPPTKIMIGENLFESSLVDFVGQNSGKGFAIVDAAVVQKMAPVLQRVGKIQVHIYNSGEPSVEIASQLYKNVRENSYDYVIGIGGGSVIDLTKLCGMAPTNPLSLEEYVSGGRSHNTFKSRGVPTFVSPTTAGSGSEVTWVSVLIKNKRKIFLSGDYLFPTIAVVDPTLTYSLPPKQTALSGLDAFSHLVESWLSKKANAITECFSKKGVELVLKSLINAFHKSDEHSRRNMSIAALLGGLALRAETVLGHSLAYAITHKTPLPHGLAVGVCLPYILELDLPALSDEKVHEIANAFGVKAQDRRELESKIVKSVFSILNSVGLPTRLSELGIRQTDFQEIARDCVETFPRKANPVSYDEELVVSLLHRML